MGLCIIAIVRVPLYIAALGVPAFAEGSHDRTQFGHEIIIAPDEKATDVTCFSCSVRVRGRVSGDLTTFGGTVVIEQDGELAATRRCLAATCVGKRRQGPGGNGLWRRDSVEIRRHQSEATSPRLVAAQRCGCSSFSDCLSWCWEPLLP